MTSPRNRRQSVRVRTQHHSNAFTPFALFVWQSGSPSTRPHHMSSKKHTSLHMQLDPPLAGDWRA